MVIPIDDEHDERLSDYRNIPDRELLVRRGLFIAEGRLVVRRLIEHSRLVTRSVLVTPPALASMEELFTTRQALPVYVVPQSVINGITGFNIHRGCLAVGERPPQRSWQDLAARAQRLVALERVANADNIGSVFRNAAAFGIEGVLLGPSCADPLYRKSIRTSMAAALSVPFAEARPWPGVLHELHEMGWISIALTPAADAPLLHDVVSRLGKSPATMVLGHEGEGLTRDAQDACTHRARIPMSTSVDSLNLAAAAAIAFYEMGSGVMGSGVMTPDPMTPDPMTPDPISRLPSERAMGRHRHR